MFPDVGAEQIMSKASWKDYLEIATNILDQNTQ
jgi:hypothetical protein